MVTNWYVTTRITSLKSRQPKSLYQVKTFNPCKYADEHSVEAYDKHSSQGYGEEHYFEVDSLSFHHVGGATYYQAIRNC